jgi:hypothetical protein
MSDEGKRSKNLLLAIAGAGLVLGATLLYMWSNHSEDAEDEISVEDIREELKSKGLDKV